MNKVNPVKKAEKLNDTFIPHYIRYRENVSISDFIDDDRIDVTFHFKKNTNYTLKMDEESLPHCCGVKEIGNLYAHKNFPIDELVKILDMKAYIDRYTRIINTNGIDSSKTFEAALAKCNNWTLVKTFKNPGSNRTIKVWMSNN